jgi:transposase
MSHLNSGIAVICIDIGKNSFHIVGQNQRDAIVLRQKWSRGQVEGRLANLPPCRIGMEACVGAHHLSRTLKALGHDARLMPVKYVRPYSKGQKNDYRSMLSRRAGVDIRPDHRQLPGARSSPTRRRSRRAQRNGSMPCLARGRRDVKSADVPFGPLSRSRAPSVRQL